MSGDYFFEYMKDLLGARYSQFITAYNEKPRHKALRVNTRKIDVQSFLRLLCEDSHGGELKPNRLCDRSFYCDVKPSLDPLYHAGLYYMQEPSASAAVGAFSQFIGERVLDLCAAPGGKCTQAADFMRGGVLFCNDKEYKRVRALEQNIQRLGISNAVISCNLPSDYVNAGFGGYFDTIIADVPCSGGGMMRYESVPYTAEIVSGCAQRQRALLVDAAELLADGGYMLYSTCTFAVEENEENIAFAQTLGLQPVDIPLRAGEERGIGVAAARRIYPMSFDGEGHFFCVMKKSGGVRRERNAARVKRSIVKLGALEIAAAEVCGKKIIDFDLPDIAGLNVIGVGTPLFDSDGGMSYALSHALDGGNVRLFGDVELGDAAAEYIAGKQLNISAKRGELIATYRGYALGAVKSAPDGNGNAVLKNRYPKYLRVQNRLA